MRQKESVAQLRNRIVRSDRVRDRIELVVDEIIAEHGWPDSLRKAAQKEWCGFAVSVVEKERLEKIWAGGKRPQRVRGAVSSLQVLTKDRQPFRDEDGRLRQGLGNQNWVLDCWEVALAAWDTRQRQLPINGGTA